MTRADNTHHLLRAAAARHQDARHRASEAIQHLDRQGQPVTFAAVAAAGRVSRTWLYRQDDLRELISRLRVDNGRQLRAPAAQRTSVASLRQRLDGARDDIAQLRAENAELRQRLERQLGEQRARRTTGAT
jgi:hypothetical protein